MMKLCDGPVLYDSSTGSIICADNGLVLATDLPAPLFGGEERSPAREQERREGFSERMEAVERRNRHYAYYHRIKRIKARRGRRKLMLDVEEHIIIERVIKGELTTWEAANQLNWSPRKVYHWVRKLKER